MKPQKIEHIVDKSIPYLLLLLTILVVTEIFFHDIALQYYSLIEIFDGIIISVFIIDLIFKYRRARTIGDFVKAYWLEILAVIPFYLIFRLYEEIGLLFGKLGAKELQQAAHVGIELEKETKLVKAVEEVKFITRAERFGRFIRPILRLPRFLMATKFYERPKKK